MKKTNRIIGIILSISILITTCFTGAVFAENKNLDSAAYSSENIAEQLKIREDLLPKPIEPEIKYPNREAINTAERDDPFNILQPKANTEPRESTATMMSAWREYEENRTSNIETEETKAKFLSQLYERQTVSAEDQQLNSTSAVAESEYTFAVKNLADGKSVKEVEAALLLSEVLDIDAQNLLVSENAATTAYSTTLTDAEEDFLYFYPVDIATLRSAVAFEYGNNDADSYEALFAAVANTRSAGDEEEGEIIEAPLTPFFGYNSGENEYIDIKSGDLRYTEPLISEQGAGGLDLSLNLVYNSKESKTYDLVALSAGEIYERRKSLEDIPYFFGEGWKLDLPSIKGESVYIPGVGGMTLSDLPKKNLTASQKTTIYVNNVESDEQIVLENGMTYWFAENGTILRQQDKYGNKIDYHYLTSRVNELSAIDCIVDSAGRVYDFSYVKNTDDTNKTTTTITKPDSSVITIKTTKNGDYTTLDSISYQANSNEHIEKTFAYDIEDSMYTSFKLDTALADEPRRGENFYLLSSVTYYDNTTTHFAYEEYIYDVSSLAAQSAYRVIERYEGHEEDKKRRYYYEYEGSSTGYPNYDYATGHGTTVSSGNESVEQPYEFGVYVYNQYALQNYYIHHTTESEDGVDCVFHYETTKYNYGPSRTYDTEKTVYTDKLSQVASVSNFYYNLETYNTVFESNVAYTYDGLETASYTNPRGNITDELYKTNITYDETYKMPLVKTYKSDPSTTVRVVNTLTDDKKSIAKTETFVNDVLTEKTEYLYDTYGNVVQTKAYYDLTPSAEKFITTNYSYTDNVEGRGLNGVYLTSKTVVGVKNVDGTFLGNSSSNGNVTETYVYDISGNVTQKTDAGGNVYSYTYDYLGNTVTATSPVGTDSYTYYYSGNAYILDTPLREDHIYHWNHYGDYTGVSRGNPETGSFDIYVINYIYDSYGNLSYVINNQSLEGGYKKLYTNNAYGDPETMKIYGSDNTTVQYFEQYSYDPRAVANGDDMYTPHNAVYIRVCDDSGSYVLQSGVKYYNMYGDLVMEDNTTETYLSESASHYDYDTNGNRIKTWYFDPDTSWRVTLETYTYDYAGRLISATDAFGNTSYITYDALGRKISESDKKGNVVYYTYDDLGRVIKTDSPFNTVTRSQKHMYYDAAGNLIKEMQSNNADNTATITFDTVEYAYDCMNNLTDVITHVSATEKNYVHYEYDVAGQMTKMITGLSAPYTEGSTAGNATEYAYDLDGNCISITDSLDKTETYTYNYNKVVVSATDRNGVRSDFTYNALGSPLTEKYYQNGALVYSKEYQYDDAGRIEYDGDDIYYIYDDRGRIMTEFQGDHIIDYSYDDRGRKSERILWADGQYDVSTTTYTYDVLSRLTAVSNSSMPTATQNTTYTYDQNGRLLTETTGGLVTSYEYNNAGLVTVKSSVLPGMDSEDPYVIPAHYEYDYNTNGNQRGKHIPYDRNYISYTYDGAGRLVLEAHGGLGIDHQTSYVYDASGNRTREVYVANPTEQYGTLAINTTDYVYDANNRLISLSSGGVTNTYTYDNNGNMLADGSKTFTYNVLNQLVSFTNGPVTANYGYLPNGLRSYKSVTDGTNSTYNSFVWDGDKLAYEYTATNANTPQMYVGTVYNYGHGLVSHSDNLNGNYILYAIDGHGDVTKLLDATNPNFSDPVDENEFDAFGNGGANEYSRMGYTGEYHDAETGFIYLRARYYSPAIGRFINEDPIRDGLNWYVYCNNNPVNFVDPTGLDAIVITSTDSVDVLGVSFGHTSVIAQDENGDWYYYYWGNKNAFVEPVPAEVMESLVNEGSLDSFNTWLNDDANKDKFENSTKSYEKSTYIEGDFSESVKYFESLIHGDSGDSGDSGDNKSVIITRKVPTTSILGHTPDRVAGPYNKDYKPFSNNCVTTSIDGLEKGILPNGKRFHSPKTFIPNIYAYILEFECDY